MSKLSGRTINALKREGITKPHQKTIGDLLQIPGIGIDAVTQIAGRIYANHYRLPRFAVARARGPAGSADPTMLAPRSGKSALPKMH